MSINSCKDLCIGNDICKSFDFAESKCQLFEEQFGSLNASKSITHYSCDQEVNTQNLVGNEKYLVEIIKGSPRSIFGYKNLCVNGECSQVKGPICVEITPQNKDS